MAASVTRWVFSLPAHPTSRGDLRLRVDWGWASGHPGILRAAKIFDGGAYSGMNIFILTTCAGVKRFFAANFNFNFRLQSCLA